jgi:hypothetical protein
MNGGNYYSMRLTDGKRNSPSFVYFAHLASSLSVCPLWHGRIQADNPFPPIIAAACHDRFLKWQLWFVFGAQADPVIQVVERERDMPHGVRSGDLGGQRSCARSSAVLRPTQRWGKCWGSREQNDSKMAGPHLTGRGHHCHLQPATIIPASNKHRTCQWFVSENKNGPHNFLMETIQKTFIFGEFRMCSIAECGFSVLHVRTLCLLTFPWRRNVASSLKINFSAKQSPSKWCNISVHNRKRLCHHWLEPAVTVAGMASSAGVCEKFATEKIVGYPALNMLCRCS